ncbi:autotransporter outer membrane beta-barrel domain-containing protein [Campylobacter hyointestinalis]|uniref:autotransporter outer membrane beta-barrel domain-containing protein n=1 Tax=Campylobacter hyointestinalis TaxID=198 RepID=UPI0007C985AF|nr:autotransporter outer membrane beta-barrel domain-containing protein [Campylobacter hyointestinalis]
MNAVELANEYKIEFAENIANFRSSAKELKDLAAKFAPLANSLAGAYYDLEAKKPKANPEITITTDDNNIKIQSADKNKNLGDTQITAVRSGAISKRVLPVFMDLYNKVGTGNNVAESANKIYVMLNTEISNDVLVQGPANGAKVTVYDLMNTVLNSISGKEGQNKTKIDGDIEKLKTLHPQIKQALDNFAASADALNSTIRDAKEDAFGVDAKIITGTANLQNDEALQEQADIVKAKLEELGGVAGAKLDSKAGIYLTSEQTVFPKITNTQQDIDMTRADDYDAAKLKDLLADDAITEEQKNAYNELLAALNSMKEQLHEITVTSAVPAVAKANNSSNVVKSLNEAGLGSFVANNLKLTTDANGQVTDATIAQDIAEQIEKPIREASNSLSNVIGGGFNAPAAALSMANQTNTMTRLAKLSTPYSKDLALASAIKNMDGLEVASGDNSALSSIIKEYTDRFNYDNSVYANVIGAKGYTDNGDPKLYGFSVGYDRSFDNFLVGSYFTYAKSSLDTSYLESEADNFELGIYSRAYLGDSEVDTTVSFGIGKNDINNYKLVNDYLNGDYDSKFINLAATYGYVVKAQNSLFIKPFIGLNYAYNKNDSFTLSNAVIPGFEIDKIDGSTLSANLGVELRKYLSDGSFMFITPSVEQELSVSRDDLVSKFRGASTSFTTQADETKDTYAKVIAGGEYAVTKDFSATVSAGFKTNGDDRYVNGSLGLKYKF